MQPGGARRRRGPFAGPGDIGPLRLAGILGVPRDRVRGRRGPIPRHQQDIQVPVQRIGRTPELHSIGGLFRSHPVMQSTCAHVVSDTLILMTLSRKRKRITWCDSLLRGSMTKRNRNSVPVFERCGAPSGRRRRRHRSCRPRPCRSSHRGLAVTPDPVLLLRRPHGHEQQVRPLALIRAMTSAESSKYPSWQPTMRRSGYMLCSPRAWRRSTARRPRAGRRPPLAAATEGVERTDHIR